MRQSTYIGSAWHGWFHVVGNTYGTWIEGDPRGFRARHHRLHVDGDYKHPPPPGVHDAMRFCSERSMRRNAVVLSVPARVEACKKFAAALRYHAADVIDMTVTAKHYHVLVRFPCTPQWLALVSGADGDAAGLQSVGIDRFDRKRRKSALDDPPRHYIGIAKKESARALSRGGLVAPGGVWARRCRPIPITNRRHQLRVVRYIRDHLDEGGAVLSVIEAPEC